MVAPGELAKIGENVAVGGLLFDIAVILATASCSNVGEGSGLLIAGLCDINCWWLIVGGLVWTGSEILGFDIRYATKISANSNGIKTLSIIYIKLILFFTCLKCL